MRKVDRKLLVIALIVAGQVAYAGRPLQALWVFPSSAATNPVTDSSARNVLITRSATSGLGLLYVSVYSSNPNSAGRFMYDEAAMADLLSQAHANGMQVYAAYGAPDWPSFGCNVNGFPLQRMKEVADYNAAHPSAKFDGVVLDVEPTEPQSPSAYQALIAQYDCIRALLPSEVALSVAIRFFWDDSIEYPAGSAVIKPVYAHIIDLNLKNVVVMGYRDSAGTSDCNQGDGLIRLDQDEIAYSKAASKLGLVLVGLETSDPVTTGISNKETFFEEGQAIMDAQAQLTFDHFGDSGGLGGFAIHNYQNSYLSGLSGLWPETNPSFPVAVRVARITNVTRLAGGHFRFQAMGIPNTSYNIEASANPNAASFAYLTTVTADSGGALQYDEVIGPMRRFYRIANP